MSQETNKPKRRWLRFSLRSFVIALTIMCVWLGWFLYRVEQQREAVEWVLENGGEVWYDFQLDSEGDYLKDSQPPWPKWLLNILDINYFASVARVDINDGKSQISDLTPLAELKNLKLLNLGDTQVSDLTPLAGLPDLDGLRLDNTQVSDVTPLAGLTNLEELLLYNTQVSDVTPLAGLTNLEYLDLGNTQVSDVTPLAGLTNLEYLKLRNTQVSDVTPLEGLTNLKYLDPRKTHVSDKEIEKLKLALPNCYIEH